jgi:3-demethoxyubiquinol 3-hydroxylase
MAAPGNGAGAGMTAVRPPYLPGDAPVDVAAMIRVDHAGEYGAVRIYDGQLAVIGRGPARDEIRRMTAQEQKHLAAFDELLVARQVRPTVLQPLWRAAGFALGAATALLGERTAMACTVAVEEVIDRHYQTQLDRLGASEPVLAATISAFRADELEHRDTALAYGATEAAGSELISAAIKAGTRLAIWLSTRL